MEPISPIMWLREHYYAVRTHFSRYASAIYSLSPSTGRRRYQAMQTKSYDRYTQSYEDAKTLCVGCFDQHESYPYERYLLEYYDGPQASQAKALDFACGIGRMINRMLEHFDRVDGVDLSQRNLDYARTYLAEKHRDSARTQLYKVDGTGVAIPDDGRYDFIYSTIAIQHIAVYEIRRQIFLDLLKLLRPGGSCCFQVGFGWDSGTRWFDNHYAAINTNGGSDVSVPDKSYLPMIEADFVAMGYTDVHFRIAPSPHPEHSTNYHKNWLFISVKAAANT